MFVFVGVMIGVYSCFMIVLLFFVVVMFGLSVVVSVGFKIVVLELVVMMLFGRVVKSIERSIVMFSVLLIWWKKVDVLVVIFICCGVIVFWFVSVRVCMIWLRLRLMKNMVIIMN